jgi:hypothetical protein
MRKTMENLVSHIETLLAEYYSFSPIVSATSFMLDDAALSSFSGSENLNSEDFSPERGSVVVVDEGEKEGVFIGLHIADSIVAGLEHANPLNALDGENLDKFCLLVEELSHFHLILNRMVAKKSVTRLELEWQAEVDKLLISSIVLKNQNGYSNQNQLAVALFDHAITTSSKKELYDTATRYAAKFWFEALKNSRWTDQKVRRFLLRNYHLNWEDKRINLENLRSA